MITTTFNRTYVCDRCDEEETFVFDSIYLAPDGWYKISGSQPGRLHSRRDKHLCQECYDELFGIDGLAWKDFEIDDEITHPITAGDAIRATEYEAETVDMSKFKNIGSVGDLKVKYRGGYFGTIDDDDDDGAIGLTD